ncbi:hypothetical protein GCM10025868_29380 [Angustibacter aerolatus]|uniref:Uncharacterized protein n=1 Tax=Angustibacter aerolatus TaxID=1162965 RepID=A0ABQ6JHL3_9ACTN|nr:hypothetical protein GCM10025868_29380 [Angustibacter aerolatus]
MLPGLSDQAPTPTTGGLTRTLKPLLGAAALGGHVSASVVDDATGTRLLGRDAGSARAPASTASLLTGVAVLSAVGGATTLPTTVVQGAGADEVVLVGGGDMMLGTGASKPRSAEGRAGLGTLARQVADALSREGRTRVAVRFDDSLFTGGTVAPGWAAVDIGYGLTGRVAALGLDRDRAVPGHPAPADLALSAARAFASALDAAGISVTGAPVRTKAPAGARRLGLVRSAPVQDVLSVALHESDNALAEGLAHLTARAVKRPATFADAPQAVLDQVQHVGIDTGPTVLLDGSGLTRGSLVPAAVLTDVLRAAGSREHPEPAATARRPAGRRVQRHPRRPLHRAPGPRRRRRGARQDRHAHRHQHPGRRHRRRRRAAARVRRPRRPRADRRHRRRPAHHGPDRRGARGLRLPLTPARPRWARRRHVGSGHERPQRARPGSSTGTWRRRPPGGWPARDPWCRRGRPRRRWARCGPRPPRRALTSPRSPGCTRRPTTPW